jgi:hypothetical protein
VEDSHQRWVFAVAVVIESLEAELDRCRVDQLEESMSLSAVGQASAIFHDAPPAGGHLLRRDAGIRKTAGSAPALDLRHLRNFGQQIFRPDLGANPVGAIAFLLSLMSIATIPSAAREERPANKKSRSKRRFALANDFSGCCRPLVSWPRSATRTSIRPLSHCLPKAYPWHLILRHLRWHQPGASMSARSHPTNVLVIRKPYYANLERAWTQRETLRYSYCPAAVGLPQGNSIALDLSWSDRGHQTEDPGREFLSSKG